MIVAVEVSALDQSREQHVDLRHDVELLVDQLRRITELHTRHTPLMHVQLYALIGTAQSNWRYVALVVVVWRPALSASASSSSSSAYVTALR